MLTNFKWIAGLLLALGVASGATSAWAQEGPPPAGPVSYQVFYDALSPYGQWVEDPDYGYAWVPTAGPDFQPYRTSGHWVYTDYGWTWVSDYQWGWAAFHYGRWRYSDAYGWLWVPGYSWGPAWVAWRQSAGYYGWAPLGPPPPRPGGVHLNIGFSFSFGDAPAAPAQWYFVPAAYVASPALATYYVPSAQTAVVYNRTTIIRNTYVVNNVTNVTNNTVINQSGPGGAGPGGRRGQPAFPAGPAPADVEKVTGQPLTPLAVSNRDKPGVGVQGKSLAFYRPEVAAPAPVGTQGSGIGPAASPAPRKVVPLAQAASLARRPLADPNRGLLRDNTARHLNSTDPDPIRVAKQQAQVDAATGSSNPATTSPRAATAARPGNAGPAAATTPSIPNAAAKQPAKAQPAPRQLAVAPAAPNAATPPSRPAPSDPIQQTDHDQQRQTRQQAQAARQQQDQRRQQQQQAQQQAQADRQQQQQAKQLAQQQQQARQQLAQQRARQQQQQARQAQQQARQVQQQARPPRPEGRPEHR